MLINHTRSVFFINSFIIFLFLSGHIVAKPSEHFKLPTASPEQVDMDKQLLLKARDYAQTGGGSGRIFRHGKLVLEWGDQKRRYDLKSTTKSFGATALGLALKDKKIRLADKAFTHHPEFGIPPKQNSGTGWLKQITIFHLATQTAGFDKPGGYQKLIFPPGTKWSYSDGGPNWLAECITLIYKKDLHDLMFQRVFTPVGIQKSDLTWRKNQYRPAEIKGIPRREFGSGIHANVDAMARLGLLYLQKGKWNGKQILTENFIEKAGKTPKSIAGLPVLSKDSYSDASDHYGLLWWNNNDESIKGVPLDAFWSWGLHESLIVVIPSLDIVAARAGRSWTRKWSGHYSVLEPFLKPIAASVKKIPAASLSAPYPQSSSSRGPRFEGGFGIYCASEPWGPWKTVYFKEKWDTGPGETCSLPTKWMSRDGKTCHLLFSGSDFFSVRKVVFEK